MEKLLIIDDEEWILEGLKLILPWNEMGIELTDTAQNGQEAIEIIENEHPTIVLTDIRMPLLDGLEIAKYVFDKAMETEVIIVSGYSDFEYARQAIKYNVSAYLTKPIDADELRVAISNIIRKLQSQREQICMANRFKEMEVNRMLSKQYLSEREINADFKDEKVYFTCVFQLSCIEMKNHQIIDPESYFLKLIKGSEWCGKEGLCFRNSTNPNQYIFIAEFFKTTSYERQYEKILYEFEKLLVKIRREMQIEGCIGVSAPYANTSLSFKAYLQASFITENSSKDKRINIISNKEFEKKYCELNISHNCIRELTEIIESGNRKRTIDILRNMTDHWLSQSLFFIRINVQETIIALSSLMAKYDGNMYELNHEYADVFSQIWHVNSGKKLVELCTFLVEAVFDYIQSVKNENKESTVLQIKHYINNHYYENIRLSDMANKYYVNLTYLSRKFKQEIGMNFNDYVREIRLQKASRLLKESDMKVYEIAQKVGFENENYFMKKFREKYDVTPSVYREMSKICK